ncbi:hypothetical protein ACIRD6_27685 [Streptomyces sp. NPDC102473]|uniref:hypothetical protein n=1 Tax=Streptomyces sp. NPDC102473 TaxID=3366180 RepID=UPI0038304827
MRRPVAFVTAIVLFVEAVGIVLVNGVLATVADNQSMSLAGMDPDAMVTGTWVMGGVSGALLVLCGLVPLLAAIRDRAPGRFGRITLIACAVVHGVLGALAVGLIGWAAFAFLMAVLALIVLTLVAFDRREPETRAEGPGVEGTPAPV